MTACCWRGEPTFRPTHCRRGKAGRFHDSHAQGCAGDSEYAAGRKKALVVGGGLLGLEAARGLQGLGLEVVIVEFFPQLMAAQLDEQGRLS
jgi:nitrite reductase (NADH) large subunit